MTNVRCMVNFNNIPENKAIMNLVFYDAVVRSVPFQLNVEHGLK